MDVSGILQKLGRSRQLASQTHKRALTHSLLNQALDKCRPHSQSGFNKSRNSDSQPPSRLSAARHDNFKQQSGYCRCCEREEAPAQSQDEQKEPNFRCKDCHQRFGSSTSHSQSEEQSFGCKDCPRRLGYLTSHFPEDRHNSQYKEYVKKLSHSFIGPKEEFNLGSNVSPRRLRPSALGVKEAGASLGCEECAGRQNSPSSGTRPGNSRSVALDTDEDEDVSNQRPWRNSHSNDYQYRGKDDYPRLEELHQSSSTSERQGSKNHESGLGENKWLFRPKNHGPDFTEKDNLMLAENRKNFLIDQKIERRMLSRLDDAKSPGCSCVGKGLENRENALVDIAVREKHRSVDKERSGQLLRRKSFDSESPENNISDVEKDHRKQDSPFWKKSTCHQCAQHQDCDTDLISGPYRSKLNVGHQPFANVLNGNDWLARRQELQSSLTSKKLTTSAKDGFDPQVSPSDRSQRSPTEHSGYHKYISKNYDLSRMEARDGISQRQQSPDSHAFSHQIRIDGQKNLKDKHEPGKKDGGSSSNTLCNERVLFERQTGLLRDKRPQQNLYDRKCQECSPGQYFNQSNDFQNQRSQEKRRSDSAHQLVKENEDQRRHTNFLKRNEADQLEFQNFAETNKKLPRHQQISGRNGYDSSELKTSGSRQFVRVPSTMQMKQNVWSHTNVRGGSGSKKRDSESGEAKVQPDIYLRINSQLTTDKQPSRRFIVDDQNWTAIKGRRDEGKDQEMSIKIRSPKSDRNVDWQNTTVNYDHIGTTRISPQNETSDQVFKTRTSSQQNKPVDVGQESQKIIVAGDQKSHRITMTLSDNSDSEEPNTIFTSEQNLINEPGSIRDLRYQGEERLEKQHNRKLVDGPNKTGQPKESGHIKIVSPDQLETQKTHSGQFRQHSQLKIQTETERKDTQNHVNTLDSEEDISDRQIYQKSSNVLQDVREEVTEQHTVKPQPELKSSLNHKETAKIYQQGTAEVYQEPKGSEIRHSEFGQSFHGAETSKVEESRYGDGSARKEFNKNVEQKYQKTNTQLLETRRDNQVNTGCSRCGSHLVQGKAELSPSAPLDSKESEICPCHGTVSKKTMRMVDVSDNSFGREGPNKFGIERWATPLGRSYKDKTVERCHCGQTLPKGPANSDGQQFMEWQPGRSSSQWQVRRTSYQQRFGQGSDCSCCSKSTYSRQCTKCQLYRSNPSLQPSRRMLSSEHKDCHQQGSTKDGHCGMLNKSQIESTMIEMAELMNNISHLCECYYDECPQDSLTAADRKHLRTFHRGVLQCRTSKLDKKFCKLKERRHSPCSSSYQGPEPSPSEPQIDKTSAAPARSSSFDSRRLQPMKEDRSQLSVRFSGTSFIPEDHSGENQKSPQSSEAAGSIPTQFESRGRNHSDDSDCHWPLADTQVYSRHNADPVNMTQSNQAEPDDLISQPICDHLMISHAGASNSSKSVSSETKPWTSESKNRSLFLRKTQADPSGLFVEGVSAFPTQKSGVVSKKIRRGKQLAKPDSDQGICIVTQPGSYIVRRPQEESSVHLLQVNPGNYIKLKI